MGDNSQSCRGFETPTLGGDLWPMSFDVDLGLDGPGGRKGPGGSLGSGGLGSSALNSLHTASSVGGGYGDIQHLSGLSSILQRFDDLHAGDICQMTDLTNSLPKGDSETAQSLLAKLACQDLGPDLSSGTDTAHKELETSLFDQTTSNMTEASGSSSQGVVLSQKAPLEAADVYGRMTCYGGKLVLQLRHINLSTNYTLSVGECWLCGEKVSTGSQLFTHKHSLNGMFQVNDEYVQLDIEHYIIPDQALDPPVDGNMTDGVLQHSDTAGLHPDLTASRTLGLTGGLTANGDGLTIDDSSSLQYTEPGLVPPLSSSANLMNSAVPVNHNSCMSNFNHLPLPGMPITSSQTNINSSISNVGPENVSHTTQPLCTASNPVFGLSDPACSNAVVISSTPTERKALHNTQISVINNYSLGGGLSNFTNNNLVVSGSIHNQPNHRDPGFRNKHPFHYHASFSNTDFSCHGTATETITHEKQPDVTSLTQLNSVTANLDGKPQRADVVPKKAESGAKKRKSRAQKKPSVIQMREYRTDITTNPQTKNYGTDPLDCLSTRNYNTPAVENVQVHVKNETSSSEHIARSEGSIEDWIKHNLPEGDLIVQEKGKQGQNRPPVSGISGDGQLLVLENKGKQSTSQDKPPISGITSTQKPLLDSVSGLSGDSQKLPLEPAKVSRKQLVDPKAREIDQTSRLAAHMLMKGIEFTCRVCSMKFGKDNKKFKAHMKEHGIEGEAFFACCFCTKTFIKGKHYTQHLETHIRTRRFACPICSASYSREAKLRRHMLSHTQESQGKKEHRCSKCPKSFSSKEYLQNHMKVHGGKKYKCETCGFLCSSVYNLDTHKLKHVDDKPFKCELCEKKFVRRDFLDNHMELVHKNKRSKCEVCGKLFSRKDVLKRHLAVHNNETYDCEVCGKKFTRKDRLATHRKMHKLHCDYKCSICPASFARKSVLLKHEKIHKTKEQCKLCYKFLSSKQKLETHLALHEKNKSENHKDDSGGPQKCEICDKTLSSRAILRKHLRRIHGKFPPSKKKVEAVEREKKFVCHWCSKGFTRSCNLSTHLLRAHSKNLEEYESDDDLPSMLQPKRKRDVEGKKKDGNANPVTTVASTTLPPSLYSNFASTTMPNRSTSPLAGLSGGIQSIGPSSDSLPFPSTFPSTSHPLHPSSLPLPSASSPQLPSSGPPDSPINLSTEGITQAAYLLAYPSYAGPY